MILSEDAFLSIFKVSAYYIFHFLLLGLVHSTPEKLQIAALFLWLGLPSTPFKPEEYENTSFTF